jgi:hypothetical protein
MATPPTFVAEYETAWSAVGAGAKTSSVTVSTGDVLVICGITESNTYTLATPTGGGLTYTLQQSVVASNYCSCYVWTAVSGSSQTFTLSVTMSGGTGYWGFNALRFSGSDGVGVSAKTNVDGAAPSLALVTGEDNSAIVVANGDWNAADGASRTWRTINGITPTSGNGLENTYARDASRATFYVGRWNDAGTAGSKTTGLSAPAGQRYSIIAVEVEGTAGGGTDATATPATIATVTALPRPAGNTTAAPATVAATGALPRPAANVAAAPAVVATVAALARPAINTVAAPAVVATATALPQATPVVAGNATATPATVATVVALPRPAADVAAAPAAVAAVTALPRPAADVAAGPAVFATTSALARPAVSVAAGPAPVAGTTALPQPAANVTVGASAFSTVVSLPTPSVGGSTTPAPATVAAVFAVLRPAVNVTAAPAAVSVVAAFPQVSAGEPDAGIVIRPNTGTVTRPGAGTVTRPFTGVVTRP